MPELKEVFEMVTKQTEPDLDSWREQEERQRRAIRSRKLGAFTVAATIGVAVLALMLWTRGGPETTAPAVEPSTPVPPAEIATSFLEAYGSFDAEEAMAYLADDADIRDARTLVRGTPRLGAPGWSGNLRQFRLAISMLEAQDYEQMLGSCEESMFITGDVRCTFDFHLLGSDRIGRGPFHGSEFNLRVHDGKIVEFDSYLEVERFWPEMWEPFTRWVFEKYPEDAALMYALDSHTLERLSEESIRLWDQHVRDYVKAVNRGTAE